MAKRISAGLLAFLMIAISLSTTVSAANVGSLDNFQKTNTYYQGQYTDVPETNAFAANVSTAFEYGIMQGYGTTFGITNNITRMASIIIACRIHAIYTSGQNNIETQFTGTLQEKHLSYAQNNGIYCAFPATDTRQQERNLQKFYLAHCRMKPLLPSILLMMARFLMFPRAIHFQAIFTGFIVLVLLLALMLKEHSTPHRLLHEELLVR